MTSTLNLPPNPPTQHAQGTLWRRNVGQWVPSGVPTLGVAPSRDNIAFGISESGDTAVGAITLTSSPAGTDIDTLGYVWKPTQAPQALNVLPLSGHKSAKARAVTHSGNQVLGVSSSWTNFNRGVAARWRLQGVAWDARELDLMPGAPSDSFVHDALSNGEVAVGSGSSAAAVQAYPNDAAREAVLWRLDAQGNAIERVWLGLAPGVSHHYGEAYGVTSVFGVQLPRIYVVVGKSGGGPAGANADDTRPTKWFVSQATQGTTVTAIELPLLQPSSQVQYPVMAGSASAVSKSGSVIVGACSLRDSEFVMLTQSDPPFDRSEATVWGYQGSPSAQSIKQILHDAGVAGVDDYWFLSANDVSADGRTICGTCMSRANAADFVMYAFAFTW